MVVCGEGTTKRLLPRNPATKHTFLSQCIFKPQYIFSLVTYSVAYIKVQKILKHFCTNVNIFHMNMNKRPLLKSSTGQFFGCSEVKGS